MEEMKLEMQKIGTFSNAAKVIAPYLPAVGMSLIGLAALSRKKCGVAVPITKKPAPTLSVVRRSGTGSQST
jgi:hypothetical protein